MDNIYVTKRQRIDPIVKSVLFIIESVERNLVTGYCMELLAARSYSMVLRADQTTREESSLNVSRVSCRCAKFMTPLADFFSPPSKLKH